MLNKAKVGDNVACSISERDRGVVTAITESHFIIEWQVGSFRANRVPKDASWLTLLPRAEDSLDTD